MPGRSKRNRRVIGNSGVQSSTAQTTTQASPINKPTAAQPYEAYKYLKNDLKWSGITAGIIAVILIAVYIFMH